MVVLDLADLVQDAIAPRRQRMVDITVAGEWLRVSGSGPEIPEATVAGRFEPFRRLDGGGLRVEVRF